MVKNEVWLFNKFNLHQTFTLGVEYEIYHYESYTPYRKLAFREKNLHFAFFNLHFSATVKETHIYHLKCGSKFKKLKN